MNDKKFNVTVICSAVHNKQFNKIAQSNLGTGRAATPGLRPIHNRRAQSFNRICQVATMWRKRGPNPSNTRFLPSQTAAQSVQPFLHGRCCILTIRRTISPKFASSREVIWTPSNTSFLSPCTWSTTPNASRESRPFSRTHVRYRQTDQPTERIWNSTGKNRQLTLQNDTAEKTFLSCNFELWSTTLDF